MQPKLTLELNLLNGLKQFRERVLEERKQRVAGGQLCIPFGVTFLDEALGGIYPNDLIEIIAKTGIGKSQLAVIIARAVATTGRRVHFFALEAEPNEIERRIKYQILADMFFKLLRREYPEVRLNYMDWHYGRFESTLGKVEDEIDEMMKDLYPGLWTFYRQGDFTVHDFEQKFLAIKDQTDLIVLDHVHYLDSDDDNENRAMKSIVKKIRDLALLCGKPVILLAHVRKSDRKVKQIAPGVDEIHGSSDIAKIATKIISLAPCHDEEGRGNRWPTYMRVVKCRVDGSRTRYTGLVGFNANTNQYDKAYHLGRLSAGEDEFKEISMRAELPQWAKSAVAP